MKKISEKNRIILASGSSARKILLERLKLDFEIISPNIDELPLSKSEKYEDLALRLAVEKAKAVGHKHPSSYIIGADQVIFCDSMRLDKPMTINNAIEQLKAVSGKSVISHTAVCLLNTHNGQKHTGIETCKVYFRRLSEQMIHDYIEKDMPLECAGSIRAEGLGITLLTRIESRDSTALIGLPLMLLTDFMMAEKIF